MYKRGTWTVIIEISRIAIYGGSYSQVKQSIAKNIEIQKLQFIRIIYDNLPKKYLSVSVIYQIGLGFVILSVDKL